MAALGRLLQVIGWLWLAFGLFGPIVELPDIGIFPGIILIFVSRILRTQAKRRKSQDDQLEEPEPAAPQGRMLNTERRQQTHPSPEPVSRATEPEPEPAPEPSSLPEPEDRGEILEGIVFAGREVAGDLESRFEDAIASVDADSEIDSDSHTPMTSAEMIARARQRWDRRP